MQHLPQPRQPQTSGNPPPRAIAHRPHGDPESGIVLLVVIFLTFLLLLSLAIAAPRWAHQLKRQRDLATIHYGEEYERAIQLYYRKFHRYPTTMKQLEDSDNIRFLRERFIDPLTGKDDWKLVRYGHAHVHPLGLWGKPLSDAGALNTSGGMYAMSGTSSSGKASSHSGFGFGSSSSMGMGSSSSMGMGSSSSMRMGSSTFGGLNSSSRKGTNTKGHSGFDSASNSGFHTNVPFVGVVPPIKGHSIVDYRGQDNYDRWEFNYDPVVDQQRAKVSILGGSPASGSNSSNALPSASNGSSSKKSKKKPTSNSPFGNSGFGNSGFGNSGFGNSGSSSNGSSSGSSGNGSSSLP